MCVPAHLCTVARVGHASPWHKSVHTEHRRARWCDHVAAVQANRVAHLQCQGCRTWLMYAYGARSVKCAICESITRTAPDGGQQQASTSGMAGPSAAAQQQASVPVPAPAPEMPAVVVQNPPTVDEDGNEVCAARLVLRCVWRPPRCSLVSVVPVAMAVTTLDMFWPNSWPVTSSLPVSRLILSFPVF